MRHTSDHIIAVFRQLLEEKPLNKITVQEIVDRCDINRNTFYYHFQDIPSLLQKIMEKEIDLLLQNSQRQKRPFDHMKPAVEYCTRHKSAVLHVYHAVSQETFLFYLKRFSHHVMQEHFESLDAFSAMAKEDLHILVHYYQCTMIGILLDWLDADMEYDLEHMLERLCFLLDGTGERAIQKASLQYRRLNDTD